MSNTLQGTGLFPSRKRRTVEFVAGSKKHKTKNPLLDNTKNPLVDKSSDTGPSLAVCGGVLGAVAPVGPNTHVQEAIHKEVQYSREGKMPPGKTLQVFQFVKKTFVVPDDFEKDHKYGPLSGVSHELRVVSAFMSGQLEARSKADVGAKMCIECGMRGHFPRYCPWSLN